VLRVATVADRTGRYYLADLASELEVAAIDPAGGRRPRPGRWVGTGASGLGLEGSVEARSLEALLSGHHPTEGHRLRMRETPVRAYDLTFAAPKSVSAVFALGSPPAALAVRAAHEDAVDAAMDYVAARAAGVRRTAADSRGPSAVDGLVAASFTHGVSRALDPHLHSHVVVANLARGDDGRWRAVDGRGLFAHARAAGALYDAVLRHGVTSRLGLEWTAAPSSSRSWELVALDPAVLWALSGRRAEILAHMRLHSSRSSPTRRARHVAWAATRETKGPAPSGAELRARWAAVARDAGWSAELLVEGPARGRRQGDLDEHRFAAAIFRTERRGVARRDALAAWAGGSRSGANAEDITRCVDALAEWGSGIGVSESVHPASELVPSSYVRRALGPRPTSPAALDVWHSAASSIVGYRARWDVRDPVRALGAATRAELSVLPARRLADHLATERAVEDALRRLGRTRERERDHGREFVRGFSPCSP
jgi:conjugative relaxase-like TrwC/TraI family protein